MLLALGPLYLMAGISATKAIISVAMLAILALRVLIWSEAFRPFYWTKMNRLRMERISRGINIWIMISIHDL